MTRNLFTRWIESFLDLIFPRPALVLEIESMNAAEFFKKAGSSLPAPVSDAICLFPYRNEYVREAVWQIKYKKNRKIARLLAELLYSRLCSISEAHNWSAPLILPLPLSKQRQKERGYNQIELVLEEMFSFQHSRSKKFLTRTDILLKQKHTVAQSSTESREQRLQNLAGCFAVNPAEIKTIRGRNIILVDDVLTTGATLEEARRILLDAGANQVTPLSLAH